MKSFLINKVLLFPYYLILSIRHMLYNLKIFKSTKFDIPVICVGNISAGGTGKTPMVEFIVNELREEKRVAVLSMGYGRKSRGFRYVSVNDSVSDSGDEPLQIKKRFPTVVVAVDKNRVRGIKRLLKLPENERPEVVVLDDAFQYRKILACCNIVLVDYTRPLDKDYLLPIGRLRDLPSQMKRADVVIVTKSPPELPDYEPDMWKNRLKINANQKLLFSSLMYGDAKGVFEGNDRRYLSSKFTIVVTGIANPKPLLYHLVNIYKIEKHLKFGDHHRFTSGDARKFNKLAKRYPKAVFYTTEKDAQRIEKLKGLSPDFTQRLFYLPIEMGLLSGGLLLDF